MTFSLLLFFLGGSGGEGLTAGDGEVVMMVLALLLVLLLVNMGKTVVVMVLVSLITGERGGEAKVIFGGKEGLYSTMSFAVSSDIMSSSSIGSEWSDMSVVSAVASFGAAMSCILSLVAVADAMLSEPSAADEFGGMFRRSEQNKKQHVSSQKLRCPGNPTDRRKWQAR